MAEDSHDDVEAAKLVAGRLASLSLSAAFGVEQSGVVVARLVYLITGLEEYNAAELEKVLTVYRPVEVDIALLRAMADVMEAIESHDLKRQDENGGAR